MKTGFIGLVILVFTLNSQGLALADLPDIEEEQGDIQAEGEDDVLIPMPYIAAQDSTDSEDIFDADSERMVSRIQYKPVLLSALLPGSGQIYQGQVRGYAYLAAEVASIAGWVIFRNKGNDSKEEFIDFAWEKSRLGVSTRNERGDDGYYEHVARWVKSGEFDVDRNYDLSDPFTIDPWTESGAYNGEQWRIASITYFQQDTTGTYIGTRADSLAALQFYAGRAYEEVFYWDWATVDEERFRANMNQYLDLRDESNSAFQNATLSLVLLMANHAVSVIDAFISSRVEFPGSGGEDRTRLDMRIEQGPNFVPGGTIRLSHRF
jgi:hypothetical protein